MLRATGISLSTVLILRMGIALAAVGTQPEPARESSSPRPNALLERLVWIPGQMQVLQSSSHNKQGLNGDADTPLYKDARGDDVIFDAAGPGCIRSMWGTWFSHDAVLNFYFDGQEEPRYRINEIEFFSGRHPDFPPPLNSYEVRGYYGDEPYAGNSFVPIPFSKSLKISISGGSRFFHVLYELYPYGTPVESFTGRENRSPLIESFEHPGGIASTSSDGDVQTVSETVDGAREEVVLLERRGSAGIVRQITIEADDSESLFQNTQVVMRWDGHGRDDVHTVTGMFFGSANRAYDVASLPVGMKKLPAGRVRLDCRFPMPFWREARIALRNRSGKSLGRVDSTVVVGPNPVSEADGAYFTALYRKGETTYGRDWPLYDSPGVGWFVGVVQSMQHQHYCEGNEHFTIDGAVSPQINGTGSEDYYLGCFWPNRQYSSPFATCAGDIQLEAGGDTGAAYAIPSSYARFHLEAPIPFFRSIDARIQHGGVSNILSNYRSLAFCYLRRRPALRQTDFLDVGSVAGEKTHNYSAGDSELTGRVTARPEGEYFETAEDEDGRRHAAGEIQFTVAVDPENDGVRIRRRLDQRGMPQAARVFVDGAYAGTWRYAYQNEALRWFDSDFDISPQYTKSKTSLALKLEVVTGPDCGVYTDFSYTVFCFARSAAGVLPGTR
ncbi:MAG: DUF2961 domain-containing protein [Phycisphaerales bacterium]